MKSLLLPFAAIVLLTACTGYNLPADPGVEDLKCRELVKRWDEGIPLGNGIIGALIWQKESVMRFSLDRGGHFSHAMTIHPLGLIDWSQGAESQRIIKATIKKLDDCDPDWWVGYSYSWLANMKVRTFDGQGASDGK